MLLVYATRISVKIIDMFMSLVKMIRNAYLGQIKKKKKLTLQIDFCNRSGNDNPCSDSSICLSGVSGSLRHKHENLLLLYYYLLLLKNQKKNNKKTGSAHKQNIIRSV